MEIIMRARKAAALVEAQQAARAIIFDAEGASNDLLNQSYEACLVEFQI